MNRLARLSMVTLAALSSFAAACSAPAGEGDDAMTSTTEALEGARGTLGSAWDSKQGKWTPDVCLDLSSKTFDEAPSGDGKFDRVTSTEQLMRELGIDVKGQAKFAGWTGDATMQFAQRADVSSGSIVMLYVQKYNAGSQTLGTKKLNADGQKHTQDAQEFRRACGDEAVTQVDVGGRVFIAARVDFDSSSLKERFDATAHVGSTWADLKVALESKKEELKDRVKVALFAMQKGGEPLRLADIVNAEAVGKCKVTNLAACDDVVNTATNYAKSFRDQFAGGKNTVPVEITFDTYKNMGIGVPDAGRLPENVADARRDLGKMFDERLAYRNVVENFRPLPAALRPSDKDLNLVGGWLTDDKAKIDAVVPVCWDDASDAKSGADATAMACVNAVTGLAQRLTKKADIEAKLSVGEPLGSFYKKMIRSRANPHYCLDMSGSREADGNPVWSWDCGGDNLNQRWTYTASTGQVMDRGNRCLDISGGSRVQTEGTAVQSWGCVTSATDPWTFDAKGRIVNRNGMCLAIPSDGRGVQAVMLTCSDTDLRQQFDVRDNP